jgi:hypothetical protein
MHEPYTQTPLKLRNVPRDSCFGQSQSLAGRDEAARLDHRAEDAHFLISVHCLDSVNSKSQKTDFIL